MTDTSKNCTITNNTAVDGVVLDAYNDSSSSTQQIYGQTLKILPLIEGGNVLKANSKGTVVLDDYSTDSNNQKNYNTIYELIIARTSDLFPIYNTSVSQRFVPQTYPDVVVDANAYDNMDSARKFYQTIVAFPSSDLSSQFQSAMNDASSATSLDDIESKMNKFFQSTKEYKSLTFNMYTSVSTYIKNFANIWAEFNDSQTYYLYKSGTIDEGSSTANPIFEGSVVFTKSSSTTVADPTDNNGGYDIEYSDSNGNNKTKLYYNKGQLVSDLNKDTPGICLQGTFILKSQLSNKQDDNQMITIISGMVNGINVMGVTTKQDEPEDPNSISAFFDPKTFKDWLNLFMTLFGVLMVIDFVFTKVSGAVKWFKSRRSGKPLTNTELDDLKKKMNSIQEEARANQQALLDRFNNQQKLLSSEEAYEKYKADLKDAYNQASASLKQKVLVQQEGQIENLAKYEVDPQMQSIAQEIRKDYLELDQANSSVELQNAIDNVNVDIPKINNSLENVVNNMGDAISQEVKDDIKESNDRIKVFDDLDKGVDKNINDADDGKVADDLDFPEI